MLYYPRALHDLAEADDSYLRRVDDWEDHFDALFTEAGDGDRRVGQLGAAQGAGAGTVDQVAELPHQFPEALAVGVVQRGRDQPAAPQ